MLPIVSKFKINNFKDKKSNLIMDIYSFSNDMEKNTSGPYEVLIKSNLINTNTIEEFNEFNFE